MIFFWSFIIIFFLNLLICLQKYFFRIFLNILNFGVIYPIFAVSCFTEYSFLFGVYCSFTILITIFLINLKQLKDFSKIIMQNNFGFINFSFLEKISLPIFFLITAIIYLSVGAGLSNPIDIYFDSYSIREDLRLTGVLGYISGWPVLLSFPFAGLALLKKNYFQLFIWFFLVIIFYAAIPLTFYPLLFSLLVFSAFLLKWKLTRKYLICLIFLLVILVGLLHPLFAMITNRAFYTIGSNAIFYFFDFFL